LPCVKLTDIIYKREREFFQYDNNYTSDIVDFFGKLGGIVICGLDGVDMAQA
jgi:hypothetical protein